VRAITELDARVLDQHFVGTRIAPPTHHWRPSENLAPTNELRALLKYWKSLKHGDRLPRHAEFDVLAIPSVLGFLMMLDVVDDGDDFHYRVYGTWIAQSTGFDMTGKRLSSVPTVTSLAAYFMASYRAVLQQRASLLAFHEPPPGQPVRRWVRLILPMIDGEDRVSRLLVGNMPDPTVKTTRVTDNIHC
jgi:hypothetical protein